MVSVVPPSPETTRRPATRLLLIADTHVPRRARDLLAEVWAAVETADVVVHAGDWVDVSLLDRPGDVRLHRLAAGTARL